MKYFILSFLLSSIVNGCDDNHNRGANLTESAKEYCHLYQKCESGKFGYYFSQFSECSTALANQLHHGANRAADPLACRLALDDWYDCANALSCSNWRALWDHAEDAPYACQDEENSIMENCEQ